MIDALLSRFIDAIDYEVMADFFLTYRSSISSLDLLEKLVERYTSSDATKVRMFVALRHWLLNYFTDDFIVSPALCEAMLTFIRSLGGRGADEVTTEARIAKELNKVWDRACDLNNVDTDGPFTFKARRTRPDDPSDFLRHRKVNVEQVYLGRHTKPVDVDSTDLLFATKTPDLRRARTPSPRSSISSIKITPRLKRMPGGILKNHNFVAELRRSVDTFISQTSIKPYLDLWEVAQNRAFNIHEIDHFVAELLQNVEEESVPDDPLAFALDKLEGRKRQREEDDVETLNITKSMGKKRRPGTKYVKRDDFLSPQVEWRVEETPLNDADSFVLPFEDRVKEPSEYVQNITQDEEVEVETLAVPACKVSDFGTIWLSPIPHRPFILDHNPAHIAQHLTTVEARIFLELDWLELCSPTWIASSSKVLEEKCWEQAMSKDIYGLATAVARFNLCVRWVISQIVLTTNLQVRVQTLDTLISIAQLCRTYSNYTTVVQIVLALQHPLVRKLKRTWRGLSRSTLVTLRDLETLAMPLNCWSLLRVVQERQLKSVEGQVVPFLGPYLSVLMENGDMLETAKTVKILLKMMDRIKLDFDIQPELLEKCVWLKALDEEEMRVCVDDCI